MTDSEDQNDNPENKNTDLVSPAASEVLSGVKKYADGNQHVGVAIMVSSDGNPSTLMIPDVGKVAVGAPVYITRPIRINGKNLKNFLDTKKVTLPDEIKNLIEDTMISCEAFYYTKDGPLLMMFELKFQDGLIETLTKDADLGKLFDIQGASVRVFKCSKDAFTVLENYAAELSA